MSTKMPDMICDENLSFAWGKALLRIMETSKRELAPLIISVTGLAGVQPAENSIVRLALDRLLCAHGLPTSAESAMTIFPYMHWERTGRSQRQKLFDWYLQEYLPRLKARDSKNRMGTYFERLISFKGAKHEQVTTTNQLEHIINEWHRPRTHAKRPRQSALQAACFDPAKDHTGQPVRGFPCLSQVNFTYDDEGGLAINAFYPTQYIADRAYGNYLGLIHLGMFMANELGLTLVRLNCYVGHPELGKMTKTDLSDLADTLRYIFATSSTLDVARRNPKSEGRGNVTQWLSGAARS